MKKQVKIIIGIVIAIAVIILGISFLFPGVMKDLASGTFGKADKYRQNQMSEKDIKLRSEFTSDTAQLRDMIQGLIYFSLFTMDLSNKIDSCVMVFKQQGMSTKDKGFENVLALEDYSGFMKNNTKTLTTTISMLTGFYLQHNADESADVEQNLRTFANYVKTLEQKDSVLQTAIVSMDNFMMRDKTLKARKTELLQLKSIRDQLLIGSIQLASALQQKPLCGTLCSYALSSEQQLGYASQEDLKGVNDLGKNADDYIQSFVIGNQLNMGSQEELGVIVLSKPLESAMSAQDKFGRLIGSAIIYNQDSYSFALSSAQQLGALKAIGSQGGVSSSEQLGNLGVVVYFSAEGLQVIELNVASLGVINATELGVTYSQEQLQKICSSESMGIQESLGNSFIGFVDVVESSVLGAYR